VKNTAQIVGLAAMLNEVGKSSVVLGREVEKEKSHQPSSPRIRCPQCGWSPRKDDLRLLRLSGRKPGQIA